MILDQKPLNFSKMVQDPISITFSKTGKFHSLTRCLSLSFVAVHYQQHSVLIILISTLFQFQGGETRVGIEHEYRGNEPVEQDVST